MPIPVTDFLLSALDPEHEPAGEMDKKHLSRALSRIAVRHPDSYARVVELLADKGRQHAWDAGTTLTISDMRPVFDKDTLLLSMKDELEAARQKVDPKEWPEIRQQIWTRYIGMIDDKTREGVKLTGNRLGNTILSGARGNPIQLRSMVSTPGLYTDYRGRIIPYFTDESFGEGVRPGTLLANSFGARSSVISTKTATQEAGDLGKQLFQSGSDLIVTEDDCGTQNGILVDLDENPRNSVLQEDIGPFKSGTMVDAKVEKEIRRLNRPVKVRSPLTCQSEHGVCSKCLGKVPTRSGWAPVGYSAGATAGTSVAEPLAQGGLNQKHVSGTFKGEARAYSGIKFLRQFVQSPDEYEDRQALAEQTGTVDRVEPAPQGGWNVFLRDLSGKEEFSSYVPQTLEVTVKPGDVIEQGRPLSSGLADVEDVIRLRGLGSGRRYYARRLGKILDDSGIHTSRQNLEVIARSNINHVQVDEDQDLNGFLPGELVGYNDAVKLMRPSRNAKLESIDRAENRILQAPVLHYTPGTKLLPSMIETIRKAGIKEIPVGDDSVGFSPVMVGLRRSNKRMKDWIARQSTSYLKGNYEEDAAMGRDTNVLTNHHFAPTLAYGAEFATDIEQTGKF